MLRIRIPAGEYWDERRQEFIELDEQTILLEHSLVSLAKWEAHWKKPFLSKEQKTRAETIDYIRCMTITENVNRIIYDTLSNDTINLISRYINESMTATTFSDDGKPGPRSHEIITAEIIYYWLVALQIPFEPCQHWHLSRLLTLVRVCNIKNQPKKKGNMREIMSRNTKLNAERRKRLGTTG